MSARNSDFLIRRPLFSKENREYSPHPDLVDAANAALTLGVPLLLTGEPGCGKTQFAWAAASALQRRDKKLNSGGSPHFDDPLDCYIRSDTRARDLLYHYDSLRRFGDTQLGTNKSPLAADARHYIVLKPLGIALMNQRRSVVLIDEIDKAPRDLPNDLLRELDLGSFEIPETEQEVERKNQPSTTEVKCRNSGIALWRVMRRPDGTPKPFIVITSNVERQLPDAFLRRCVFYHIRFPDKKQLMEILKNYFLGGTPTPGDPNIQQGLVLTPEERAAAEELLPDARNIFLKLRELKLTKLPATAELINWVEALIHYREHWKSVDRLAEVAANIEGKKPEEIQKARPWRKLPALGCLIKLREDLDRLVPPLDREREFEPDQ